MRVVALWLSILMIFVMPWESALLIPGAGTLSRVLGVVVGGFWVLTVLVEGVVRRPVAFHGIAIAFFLWNVVTLFWTIDVEATLERSFAYLRMAALMLMVWDLYRTPAVIKLGLQAYVLGLCVPIGSTIYNFLSGVQSVWGRYSGTGDNANTTGIVIALGIPLAFYLAGQSAEGRRRQWIWQAVNYGVVGAGLLAIGLTATRFAALMTLPAFLFAFASWSRVKIGNRILLAVALVATLLTIPSLLPGESVDRMGSVVNEVKYGSLTGRTVIWRNAVEIWLGDPIGGVGSGAFHRAVMPRLGRGVAAHNSFLAVLAETGIIGFVLLTLILLTALFQTLARPKAEMRFWLTVLVVLGLGNLAMTFIHVKSTWLLLSLNAAGVAVGSKRSGSIRHYPVLPDPPELPVLPDPEDPQDLAESDVSPQAADEPDSA